MERDNHYEMRKPNWRGIFLMERDNFEEKIEPLWG